MTAPGSGLTRALAGARLRLRGWATRRSRVAQPGVTSLSGRLQPHVRWRYGDADDAWWSPGPHPGARSRGTGTAAPRAEELAQVYGRLALLLEVGDRFSDAVTQVVCGGRGAVAAELHGVADAVRSGEPPAEAVHRWARRSGCPATGALAADLRRATSSDDVVAALRRHADLQRHVAHQRHIGLVRRRVEVVRLAALTAVALSTLAFWM